MEARALLWGIPLPLYPIDSPPKSFQSQVPWPTGPRIGPSPRLPAWLSSTADVHRGVALDDWIPWALQRGRGRKDEDSGLDRGLMRPRSCVCGDLIFTVTVQVHTDESVDVHVSWCAFSPCAICRACSNYLFLVKWNHIFFQLIIALIQLPVNITCHMFLIETCGTWFKFV